MRIYTASIMRYYKDVITDWITTQGAPAIIRKDLPPMMNAFPPKTEFPLDPAGAEDVLTAPTSFGPSFPSEFPFEDEPHKGKKKGKKGKKARKKAPSVHASARQSARLPSQTTVAATLPLRTTCCAR